MTTKTEVIVDKKERNMLLTSLKGALIAMFVSLIGILIFAFLIKIFPIADSAIKPVNQVIKGISVLVGCIVALRKIEKNGLFNGIMIGLIYTIISFIVFSILDGNFEFSRTLLNDVLFSGIIGAICGVITVNLKKRKK